MKKKLKLGKWETLFSLAITIMMESRFCYGAEISTFCEVPSVGKGERTDFTCYFSENLHMRRIQIKIIHYTTTNNGVQDISVLLCQLPLNQTRCHTHHDYIFDGVITDKLTLVIPHAGEEHTGTYLCHVLHQDGRSEKQCNFTFNDHNLKTSPAVSVSQVTESPGDTGLKRRTDMTTILASVLGSLVVVLVAVIAVMMVIYRKWIKTYLYSPQKENVLIIRGI